MNQQYSQQKTSPHRRMISEMPPAARRVRPLAIGMAVMTILALLSSILLTGVLRRNLPTPERFTITAEMQDDAVDGWIVWPPVPKTAVPIESSDRGMLVLFADIASPRVSDRLLAAALADAGYGIAVIPSTVKSNEQAPLAAVMNWITTKTGLRADQMIAAGYGNGAASVTAALVSMQYPSMPSGLILIAPSDAGNQLDARLAAVPRRLKTTIITAAGQQVSSNARDLYYASSGEDASLFPGLSGPNALSAEVYLSVDGQRRLVILPQLSILNEGWSPRLHQTMQQAVTNDPAAAVSGPVPIRTLYNRLLLPIWTLLLLASVPLLLTLTRTALTAAVSRSSRRSGESASMKTNHDSTDILKASADSADTHARVRSRSIAWIEVALYLPATALAIPLGRLMARLAADDRLANGYTVYALIGIYGWFFLLLHLIDGRTSVDDRMDLKTDVAAIGRTLLFAFVYLTAVLFWLTTVFGSAILQGRALALLLPSALILMPAMLPACIGYRRSRSRQRLVHTLRHLALPVIYLTVIVLQQGTGSLASAATILLLLIAGRVVAKSLSWDPAPQLIASAAGAWLMLLLWPMPII